MKSTSNAGTQAHLEEEQDERTVSPVKSLEKKFNSLSRTSLDLLKPKVFDYDQVPKTDIPEANLKDNK